MTQMTPERAGPLIHVKALRGSNAYAYFWLSEGLRRWPNGYDVAPEAGRNQRLDPAHASQPPPLIASPRNLVGIFRLTYWCVTVAILLGWEKGNWKSTLDCASYQNGAAKGLVFGMLGWAMMGLLFFPLLGLGLFATHIGLGVRPAIFSLAMLLTYSVVMGTVYASFNPES
jgi:hypothetical protein